jgi:hypothetical protein
MKINKTVIVMTILILWTIFSIGFVCVTKVNEFKLNQMNKAAQQGYQQAIIDIATTAEKCEQTGVPLNVGTDKDGKQVTVTIVSASCLQKAQDSAAAAGNQSAPAATTPKK